MEETFVVIMLKNKETGFLEQELGSYRIEENEGLLYNIYAMENQEQTEVHIRLSVDRELKDWEYSAVYDYYDTAVFENAALSVSEEDGGYNPVWDVVVPFYETAEEMEEVIRRILHIHKAELSDVYQAIVDLQAEYE